MGSFGFESKSNHNTERGLHPPLLVQTQPNQVTNGHKQLCQPTKTVPPSGALYQLTNKNAVEPVANQNLLGFYNRLFLVPKPNNWWRPILGLSTLNTFLNTESLNPRDNKDLPTARGVGHLLHQFTASPGSTCVFTSRASPTSSKLYPLVCPQHPWSSQWWPKRSN